MVSPSKLVEVISQATGFPLPSVVDIDRKLVAAGLRRKGGRGPHVAQMTATDSARLLTAVLGSPQSTTAASAVRRYEDTGVEAERSDDQLYAPTDLDDLIELGPEHSFVEALTALIVSAATGSLSKALADSGGPPHIEIYAFTRATRGRIRIAGLSNGRTASVEYAAAGSAQASTTGDLEQSRRITGRTIYPVAALFGMEAKDDRA